MTDLATSSRGGERASGFDPRDEADEIAAREVAALAGEHALDPTLEHDLGAADDADPDDPDNLDVPDDMVEIEYDGRTYHAPRELKDAFLRHADYTRKTQELAEMRRALERHAQDLTAVSQQDVENHARLMAVDDQVRAYEQVDWNSLEQQDPVRAQRMWREYTQLKEGRAELAAQLGWMQEQRAIEAQRHAARRIEEGHHALASEIEGWSPELANRLADFGQREFGFSDQELGSVEDPRMIKVLHLAYVGSHALRQRSAADRLAASQAARPASRVGANAPAGRNPDRMTTDEWMAFERDRLRRNAGR